MLMRAAIHPECCDDLRQFWLTLVDAVERPMELAKYVLRAQPSWTEDQIDAAMHAGLERSDALKQPLAVYLVYFTAWEENGAAKFADDVYGYDRKQIERN